MGAWYAVHVKRHKERAVARHLGARSVPVLLPLIEIGRRYAGRRVMFLQPLFPGYLFVQGPAVGAGGLSWNTVRWAPGVRAVLTVDGVPVPVPDDAVALIEAKMRKLGFIRVAAPFPRGSRLRIRRGPLAGLDAMVERPASAPGRVRILLALLGQQTRVEIDTADLERV